MDKNSDYNNFGGYYGSSYDNFDPMSGEFNPMSQYEQAYMYYRYLSQAMEYKIKCKEYEKLIGRDIRGERKVD